MNHRLVAGAVAAAILCALSIVPPAHAQFAAQGSGLAADGHSVALSADGNTAIVGSPFDNSHDGAARVFVRDNAGNWAQQGPTLTGDGSASNFGSAVALSSDGNTAIVGEALNNSSAGAAFVFTRTGTTWSQQQRLTASDASGAPKFGSSVALSADGSTAIIGGPEDDSLNGAAWIFTRSNTTWTQKDSKLTPNDADPNGGEEFGYSVALSSDGTVALIGGPLDTTIHNGAAWIFTLSSGSWGQSGNKLTPSDGTNAARFGWSVALSADGNTALIGGEEDNAFGAAWVFVQSSGNWTQQGSKITPTGTSGSDPQFGWSVALSKDGGTALIGGPGDNSSAGAAWVFVHHFGTTTWNQQGSKLTGGLGDNSTGLSAALSSDGNTALIGCGGCALPFVQTPTLINLEPASGTTAGGDSIQIDGTGFGGVDTAGSVTFDGVAAASITVVDPDTLLVTTPGPHTAGAVDVVITNSIGNVTGTGAFTYDAPPRLTSITPNAGPTAGGTHLTLVGTHFTDASEVRFGGLAGAGGTNLVVVNDTHITVTAPLAGGPGSIEVDVRTPGGVASKPHGYTYYDRPAITAINPDQGTANGGTLVSIVGTALKGVTGVSFGGTPSASFSASSDTKATATAPAHAVGTVNVLLVTPGGTSAADAGAKFTYSKVPVATSIAKFAGGKKDGANPNGWLVADSKGALYGTTSTGGAKNLGTVFKLTPGSSATSWTKTILHSFTGTPDGATPFAGLTIDKSGNLYGTASAGGANNVGAVVKLSPPNYAATVLYSFTGPSDGGTPIAGVARDTAGNLYGTTVTGGAHSGGTVFKLKPNKAGTAYTFSVLHAFTAAQGDYADGTVILDSSGNLYGTGQSHGVHDAGIAFKITPAGAFTLLHAFGTAADGKNPNAGLVLDSNNTLYGTTTQGGATSNDGAVFKLAPPSTKDTPLLFTFTGANGMNPNASLVLDAAAIVYGTATNGGAHGKGAVFKLVPPANGQTAWTQSVMYSFKGGAGDGAFPTAKLLLGKAKTLYGTTRNGGSTACGATDGCGAVFMVQY